MILGNAQRQIEVQLDAREEGSGRVGNGQPLLESKIHTFVRLAVKGVTLFQFLLDIVMLSVYVVVYNVTLVVR